MIKLEWSPTFEIGVEKIDAAHRRLFDMANEIREAIEKQDRALWRARVQAFIDESEKHFAEEEQYLADVGYAEAEDHKAYHTVLLNQAKRLKDACDEVTDDRAIHGCYVQVMAFLIDDVVRGDHSFKSFLDHLGLTG
ncbi:MAG: hemerythrin domain-containing protein [Alphaproteobacteria bacterium]